MEPLISSGTNDITKTNLSRFKMNSTFSVSLCYLNMRKMDMTPFSVSIGYLKMRRMAMNASSRASRIVP